MDFSIPGAESFQAGTLFCIGRNYVEHAKELNNPVPSNPLIFLKPRNSLVLGNGTVILPSRTSDVHHEVELVLVIGQKTSHVSEEEALSAVHSIAIGVDFTARDLQEKAKDKGHPWSVAKGFDTFAPLGKAIPFDGSLDLQNLEIELKVNGETRQFGSTRDMIFDCKRIISELSSIFTLYPGDLIYTGTPEGVSAVKPGDLVEATLLGTESTLKLDIRS
jgi:2-keto-4-pentenoate hydratase/2-oxohepta-3-ene-1,7-dioic acid hydratase in catechol pathway